MKMHLNYKFLLAIPAAVLLFSITVLVSQYSQTGEWFQRSIELKGGMLITVNTGERLDFSGIENSLRQKFQPINVREVRSFEGYGTVIETSSEVKSEDLLAELDSMGIDTSRTSVESIGPSLGSAFWSQAQIAVIIAFIFMGIVVFIMFRTLVPSVAVITSAIADILMALALMQVLGIELSLAGLAAVLMLIGYSVDTDIMLISRLLKESEEKKLKEKLIRALKTGLTMTFTSMGALAALLISSLSPVLTQIATVLFLGLMFDLMNTWLTNSVVLRWYCERKGLT